MTAEPTRHHEHEQKAVIYCRVSGAKQVREGDGLASQESRCREYARLRGYEVVEVFRDDMTGKVARRPGMTALLSFLKTQRKQKHVVVIDDISRFARDVRGHWDLRDLLRGAGGKLESPTMEFGEDSDSILVENLLASVAQHQREKNAEQTRNRMRGRMMNGYWVFRPPPGYRYEKHGAHGKLLVRDEPVASILQEALERYASGTLASFVEIKRFLENQPEYPKDRDGSVHPSRVTELLSRPIYAGYITHEPYGLQLVPAKHEALVDLTTWQKVQDRKEGRVKAPFRADLNADFPLRGFVACGDCGEPMTACWSKGRSRRYPYYLCDTKGCASYRKSVRKEEIEDAFEHLLERLTPAHALIEMARAMFRDAWNQRAAKATEAAAALKRQLAKAERTVEGLLERVLEAESPSVIGAYERKINELELEKAVLAEKIARVGEPVAPFERIYRTALDFLANPLKLWRSERLELQRTVLRLVFTEPLKYVRNEGYRTAKTSIIFNMLEGFKGPVCGMVPGVGLEPT